MRNIFYLLRIFEIAKRLLGWAFWPVMFVMVVFGWMVGASFAHADVCASHLTRNDGQTFGYDSASNMWATSFTVSQGCTVDSVSIDLAKVLLPSDNVLVSIYSDAAGVPGSLIEAGTVIPGSSVTGSHTLYSSVFAGTTNLVPGTTYWVHITRSGATSMANFYTLGYDTAGSNKYYYSGTWQSQTGQITYSVDGTLAPPTTASTTLSVVHNPTLDMWLGIVLFFFVFVFVVWFFRRPYDTY